MPIVRLIGSGEAERTFVMFHGLPGGHRDLDLVYGRAPHDARCALHELPDHGAQGDELDVSLDLFERDVVESVRALAGPVVLVGYSMTAYLAARAVAVLGEKVERLVLVGGFPWLEAEHVQLRLDLAAALRSGELDVEGLKPALRDLFLGEHATDGAAYARVVRAIDETPLARLYRIVDRIAQLGDPSRRVAPFGTPADVLHGERDAAVPARLGRALAGLGSHARFVPIDTSSHALPWTHAELVAAHVFASPDR